jgi:hypothetical protein
LLSLLARPVKALENLGTKTTLVAERSLFLTGPKRLCPQIGFQGPWAGLQTWIFPASGLDRNSLETALSDVSCNVSPIFQAMPCPEALATLVAQTYALQVKPIMWCEYFIAIDRFDLAQQVLRATMDMSPQMASSFASFADVSQQGQKLPGSIHKIYYEHACKLGLFTLS